MTAKTRSTLNSDADTNLADNTAGDISAEDVRTSVKDLADSAVLPEDLPVSSVQSNLLEKTEQFDDAYWGKENTTVTANDTTAPDGAATADKILETTANGNHNVHRTSSAVTVTASSLYCFSAYIKGISRRFVKLSAWDSSFDGLANIEFDILGGWPIVSTRYQQNGFKYVNQFVFPADNGFFRCGFVFGIHAVTALFPYVSILNDSNVESYTGDAAKGIYLWGAQLCRVRDDMYDAGIYQAVA